MYPASAWVSAHSPSCPEPEKSALSPLCEGWWGCSTATLRSLCAISPCRDMGDIRGADHRRGKDPTPAARSLSSSSECTGAAALGVPIPRHPLSSPQMAEQLMTLAYDNGINLFDTAEVYAAGK